MTKHEKEYEDKETFINMKLMKTYSIEANTKDVNARLVNPGILNFIYEKIR